MGAGSYMEFEILDPSYTTKMAKEYMSCLRVVLTDTNTGYIYGYAALDMSVVEVNGISLKAPLRLFDKNSRLMIEGDTSQYLCRLEKNLEKNLTVYVYLDGAKVNQSIASATYEKTLSGVMNLQFSSSADLKPAFSGNDVADNGRAKTLTNCINSEVEISTLSVEQSNYYVENDGGEIKCLRVRKDDICVFSKQYATDVKTRCLRRRQQVYAL
jgi:hypothetical protein